LVSSQVLSEAALFGNIQIRKRFLSLACQLSCAGCAAGWQDKQQAKKS